MKKRCLISAFITTAPFRLNQVSHCDKSIIQIISLLQSPDMIKIYSTDIERRLNFVSQAALLLLTSSFIRYVMTSVKYKV